MRFLILFIFLPFCFVQRSPAAVSVEKGEALYRQFCFMCHQLSGQGSPGLFPPLAKSDFLVRKEDTIKAVLTGLSGKLMVNGKTYNGVMPAAPLTDPQVADVLSYVRQSWGNKLGPITVEEVAAIRAKNKGAVRTSQARAETFHPLPSPPAGFELKELVRLPDHVTRLASDGTGRTLLALTPQGAIYQVDCLTRHFQKLVSPEEYLSKGGEHLTLGLFLDRTHGLFVTANQRVESRPYVTNQVTIFRASWEAGKKPELKAWFQTNYPYGVGPYNHGVGHVAVGPDGQLYVSSGSRTDGNEPGNDSKYFGGGETALTACMWRFDLKKEKPELEVFAQGLRNTYGFCWNDRGELFATDNGPDADLPEELNRLERGGHYGFPFQFSDGSQKPYEYTPSPQPGKKFISPVINLGPDGGFGGTPFGTFDPHSSPSGIIFLGKDFPESVRNTFLVARYGNLLSKPKDVGFDLLQVRVQSSPSAVAPTALISTFLAPLARPVDLHLSGTKIFIAEYSRALDFKSGLAMMPGRILELGPSAK